MRIRVCISHETPPRGTDSGYKAVIYARFECAAVLCFFAAVLPFSAYAEYRVRDLPDSSDIRKQITESWFLETVTSVLMKTPEIYYNGAGQIFQVRWEYTSDAVAVAVVPRQADGSYPVTAPGSWVLYRDRKTGAPIRIRLFVFPDPEVFVQIYPSEGKAFAEFLVFNSYAARGVPIGIPFEQLYAVSIKELAESTGRTLPWQYTEVDSRYYSGVRLMTDIIEENLSRFVYEDDAAYDEYVKPVYISDEKPRAEPYDEPVPAGEEPGKKKLGVNCSGFVKWIIDGLVYPQVGSYLKIAPLKTPTTETDGTRLAAWEAVRDPFFGLDWTRNLAAAAMSVSLRRNVTAADSGGDVQIEAFSEVRTFPLSANGRRNTVGYMQNAGYRMELLKSLLFVLAATDPDMFYLGAVRTDFAGEDGTVLPQFTHTAAFFPWFDEKGHFRTAVYESGRVTELDEFMKRYPQNFIHLVRVSASEVFFPL